VVPTFIGKGAATVSVGAADCIPATSGVTRQSGDIDIVVVETEGEAPVVSAANSFVEVGSYANQTAGTGGTSPASTLAVYWKREASGTDAVITFGDSGDHQTCQLFVFRDTAGSGDPWDVIASGNNAGAQVANGANFTIPGVTTTVVDTLFVLITSVSTNNTVTANCGTVTNSDLTSLTERNDSSNTQQLGGGNCLFTGVRAATGTVGATTVVNTSGLATYAGALTIALKGNIGAAFTGDVAATATVTGLMNEGRPLAGSLVTTPRVATTILDPFSPGITVSVNVLPDGQGYNFVEDWTDGETLQERWLYSAVPVEDLPNGQVWGVPGMCTPGRETIQADDGLMGTPFLKVKGYDGETWGCGAAQPTLWIDPIVATTIDYTQRITHQWSGVSGYDCTQPTGSPLAGGNGFNCGFLGVPFVWTGQSAYDGATLYTGDHHGPTLPSMEASLYGKGTYQGGWSSGDINAWHLEYDGYENLRLKIGTNAYTDWVNWRVQPFGKLDRLPPGLVHGSPRHDRRRPGEGEGYLLWGAADILGWSTWARSKVAMVYSAEGGTGPGGLVGLDSRGIGFFNGYSADDGTPIDGAWRAYSPVVQRAPGGTRYNELRFQPWNRAQVADGTGLCIKLHDVATGLPISNSYVAHTTRRSTTGGLVANAVARTAGT
jgi:hypothetical protein